MDVKLLRNIMQMISGNGLAQLIQFLALFFLLRIYSPEEFSELAIAQSISTFIAVLFTLQLNHTIPITPSSSKRKYISIYIVIQVALFSMLLFILSILFFGINVVLFGIVLGAILALYNLNVSILGAQKDFGLISKVMVFRSIAIVSLQYLFSYCSLQYSIVIAVILAEVMAQSLFYQNYCVILREIKKVKRISKVVWSKYKDFYLYGACTEIIAILAFTFPLYFIDHTYGKEVSGNYGMSYRLVWGPVVLLTSSVCQVVYAQMGTLGKNDVKEYLNKFKVINIILFLLLLSLTLYVIQPILDYIFSDEWKLAASLIPILGVWGGIYIAVSIYRLTFRLFHIQKYLLFIDFFYLVLLVIFSFAFNNDVYEYLYGVLLLYLASSVITISYLKYYIRGYNVKIIQKDN